MALYTDTYFRNLAQTQRRLFSKSIDSMVVESNNKYSEFDIFLSHSYLDKEVIAGIGIELSSMGYSVYIDWIIDKDLSRTDVNKTTVQKIKSRMKHCKSLYFATSQNTSNSKWMPWELGYMDGNKDKCAILPISTVGYSVSEYKGQEYLSVYPYVVKEIGNQYKPKLWVVEDPQKYILFDEWLKGKKPFIRNVKL